MQCKWHLDEIVVPCPLWCCRTTHQNTSGSLGRRLRRCRSRPAASLARTTLHPLWIMQRCPKGRPAQQVIIAHARLAALLTFAVSADQGVALKSQICLDRCIQRMKQAYDCQPGSSAKPVSKPAKKRLDDMMQDGSPKKERMRTTK